LKNNKNSAIPKGKTQKKDKNNDPSEVVIHINLNNDNESNIG